MKKYNLECPARKSNPYSKILKATLEHSVAKNILARRFNKVGRILTHRYYLPEIYG